jgi:uncharacterized protein (TIGR00369 family)
MNETPRDMSRWLGDGGMPIIAALGGAFDAFGAENGGWATGTWLPTAMACNPRGVVQAGVHAVLHDAAMNFAVNAGLPASDRARATLELKTELMRAAQAGDRLALRGEVTRQARQVAYVEATVRNEAGELVSRATGTFLLQRAGSA